MATCTYVCFYNHSQCECNQTPSSWTIFAFILTTYFLVTGGIIYDVIVEPPRLFTNRWCILFLPCNNLNIFLAFDILSSVLAPLQMNTVTQDLLPSCHTEWTASTSWRLLKDTLEPRIWLWTDLFLGPCQQLHVFPGRCWSHGNTCNSVSNSVFVSSLQKVLDQTHNPSTPKINRMMLQVWNQLT